MKLSLSTAVFAASTLASFAVAELDPIIVKGNKFFFKSNGTQFFMKGIAYQADSTNATEKESFVDPLADADGCKRDVPYLQRLGTNVIRVYAIDTSKSHDECMKLLDEAGIYVVSDLSEPGLSINRDAPSWNDETYARYTSVVDTLQKYSNVMGFFAGNEVSNNKTNTNASPFVKAAVRDMKKYIRDKRYRSIPVGYATNDDADIRLNLAKYFNCGNEDEAIDFWGYNIYSWCGDSSFQESGFDKRTEEFETYSKPVFFAEYGCNIVQPRKFTEVSALYGKQMAPVWSGGIVYMYFQEANDYGLVDVDGKNVKTRDDFGYLQSQIAKATPSGAQESDYTPTATALASCPPSGSAWKASTKLPPRPDQAICSCMVKTLGCVAKNSVQDKGAGSLFSYICGDTNTDCSGILADGATGKYGTYSMCSTHERLSWAMNAYYINQDNRSDACDFDGAASLQTAEKDDDCNTKLKDVPSGDASGASSGSGSGGDDKKDAGFAVLVPLFGALFAVFITTVALL